jgi:hypothetical protein
MSPPMRPAVLPFLIDEMMMSILLSQPAVGVAR